MQNTKQQLNLNNTCGMHPVFVSELRIAPQMSPPQVLESKVACLSFVTIAFRAQRLDSAVVVSGYASFILHLGVVWHVDIHKNMAVQSIFIKMDTIALSTITNYYAT